MTEKVFLIIILIVWILISICGCSSLIYFIYDYILYRRHCKDSDLFENKLSFLIPILGLAAINITIFVMHYMLIDGIINGINW